MEQQFQEQEWKTKTELGRKVKSGELTDIDLIIDSGTPIMEPEIITALLPNLDHDMVLLGQAKGKFGGGQKRAFRQTQKKTSEGNKPKFTSMVVVGNRNGYVGLGSGSSKETVPSREKALRRAKLNVIRIKRGCGSWQCGCGTMHSVPFVVESKVGSVYIKLMPAPKGVGLCIHPECQKMLSLAGIKDVWSETRGKSKSTMNLMLACFDALKKLSTTRVSDEFAKQSGIIEGGQ